MSFEIAHGPVQLSNWGLAVGPRLGGHLLERVFESRGAMYSGMALPRALAI